MSIIAIVGRPNVGKSTLFNRLVERREAIVDSISGVTRDRNYGKTDWNGKVFSLIDTGGYVQGSDDIFEKEIDNQVNLAIEEADGIIFVVDVETGLVPDDIAVANLLRKTDKPIFLTINKVDNHKRHAETAEFYTLGYEKLYPISSINGSGTGELLDAITEILQGETETESELPALTVVGRPNAGKSSFINALIGQDRFIVTDIAGTTRDATNIKYNMFGFEFELIDTAGIRKKGKVKENIEFYSVMRSVRAIENSDVCLLLVDATRGFEKQDLNIFWLINRNKKGVVILVNKWDLIEKDHNSVKNFEKEIRKTIEPFTDVPILFISVLNKQRIYKAVETAMEVYKNRSQRIKTSELNDALLPILQETPPPAIKGKYIKIKYCTQLPTKTPQFAFFANLPQYIKEPYRRFLENKIRKIFNFQGVPIDIFFRSK